MRASVLAVLAISILFFVPGLRESFEPPKVAAVRVVGLALLAYVAVSSPMRRFRAPLDLVAGAWLVAEIASTLTSESRALSLVGEPVQREGLLTSMALAGIYFGTRGAWRERGFFSKALDVLLIASMLASLVVLLQMLGLDPFGWAPSYQAGPSQTARPFGTLGHPNLLGAVAAALAPLAFAAALQDSRGRLPRLIAGLVLSLVCIATLSRGAMLGCAAGVAMTAVMLAWDRRRSASKPENRVPSRGMVWIGTGALAVFAALVVTSGVWRILLARLGDVSLTSGTGGTRVEIWRTALGAWRTSPWLGTGPDTFALVFPHHQTLAYWKLEWGGLPVHAHSVVLQLLSTRGVVGVAAAIAWIVALKLAWARAWGTHSVARPILAGMAGAVGALIVAGGFGAIGITGALMLAIVTSAVADMGEALPAPAPQTPPYAKVAALLVGSLAFVWGSADIVSSRSGNHADAMLASARAEQQAVAADRLAARDRATFAARLAPLDDMAQRVRAEALLGVVATGGDARATLEASTAAADRALALAPTRTENHEQRARVFAARALSGDSRAKEVALHEIERLAALAPHNALLLQEAALIELALDEPGAARARASGIVRLYPDDGPAWLTLAMTAVAVRDTAAALDALERAGTAQWHGDEASRSAATAYRERLSNGPPPGQP